MTAGDGRRTGDDERRATTAGGGRATGVGGHAPTDGGLPVVDPGALGPPVRQGRVVGVLLAAGASERFGEANKLVAAIDDEPMVRRSARALVENAVSAPTAVVGYEADRVRAALADLPIETVENPDYAAGQSTSVRVGVRVARAAGADAVCVSLGDMPWIRPTTVDALVRAWRAGAGDALAAAVGGERGNPVLFAARHFDALAAVDGDAGGRELFLSGGDVALVETGDPGVRRDVDELDDLAGDG